MDFKSFDKLGQELKRNDSVEEGTRVEIRCASTYVGETITATGEFFVRNATSDPWLRQVG